MYLRLSNAASLPETLDHKQPARNNALLSAASHAGEKKSGCFQAPSHTHRVISDMHQVLPCFYFKTCTDARARMDTHGCPQFPFHPGLTAVTILVRPTQAPAASDSNSALIVLLELLHDQKQNMHSRHLLTRHPVLVRAHPDAFRWNYPKHTDWPSLLIVTVANQALRDRPASITRLFLPLTSPDTGFHLQSHHTGLAAARKSIRNHDR